MRLPTTTTPCADRRTGNEYDRFAEELRRCARVVDGTDDWSAVLKKLNADHPPTPELMRQSYAEATERARTFLRRVKGGAAPPLDPPAELTS